LKGLGTSTPPLHEEYKGWELETPYKGMQYTKEIYVLSEPDYISTFAKEGQKPVCSVPILFDEKTNKIVNNESSQIVMMLNTAFNKIAKHPSLDLYPEHLREQIDQVNGFIYPQINDGVYRCGFAKTQSAYDAALEDHWEGMDRAEAHLEGKQFLVGEQLTMADIRLFPTLVRYDAVYFSHFKTCRNHLTEMPNLLAHTRRILQLEGIKGTTNLDKIVEHYYWSQPTVNPTRIVPRGLKRPRGFEDILDMDEFFVKKQAHQSSKL
jgi:putative glutathione S-transferase